MQVEIAVAMFNSANPLGAKVGDIVAARPYRGVIGTVERCKYLWLVLDAVTSAQIAALSAEQMSGKIVVHKYRYQVPVEVLRQHYPDFDLLAAMSPVTVYQPALDINEANGRVLRIRNQFKTNQLVVDKQER